MKYAKSSKGYYVPKGGAEGEPGDPLSQFSKGAMGGQMMSFTEAGFRKGTYGDREFFHPVGFGQGASQVVNIGGTDYTIGFTKDKNADNYSAVLVDKTGNVRQGDPNTDQVANEVLANFQNLNPSQMATALYKFGTSQTTGSTQKWGGAMQAVEGVRKGM
jgi:hypothetical protein